ncbi:GNAT family N-acetyltransferase [Tsukamurella sp. 8F]|uniref:GNAT family N-acetyltransferase n=1 Tax=unclassified Tsukamurella TaxID=2633480 RepID=UPI0023B8E900|nr:MULTISPECIES: GNAT family N-acetyltransferase [unclassified Tsukamurella]MDF0531582.1 GNAT family N-acetyltransferase [Tsukamurella sp. 8J]MDF0587571.1 GNAT family N-acetyltransferase [Tsukamurella sp. 8F]
MLKMLHERTVSPRDTAKVLDALGRNPVASCMVTARIEEFGVEPASLGGRLWTHGDPGESLCFAGVNLIPLLGSDTDMRYFAGRAARGPRTCSSLVGPADLVLSMWDELESSWGPAREVRERQPLMALTDTPAVAPHPGVRPAHLPDLDEYMRAAVAMFTSEVGVDPCTGDGGRAYRRRVTNSIIAGRSYVLLDGPTVAFKAEVGALSERVGQIQGVWVRPDLRGQGLGATGTAAVAAAVLRQGRIPSLYVNDFNVSARKAYQRIGFREVGTFATVMVH